MAGLAKIWDAMEVGTCVPGWTVAPAVVSDKASPSQRTGRSLECPNRMRRFAPPCTLAAKAKKQKKAAKAAARAAREKERAEIEAAKASLARSGRAAKRAMAGA